MVPGADAGGPEAANEIGKEIACRFSAPV